MKKIHEIRKPLADVKAGEIFRIPPYGRTYIRTDRERDATVTVVDITTGQMANLYGTLTVVDLGVME